MQHVESADEIMTKLSILSVASAFVAYTGLVAADHWVTGASSMIDEYEDVDADLSTICQSSTTVVALPNRPSPTRPARTPPGDVETLTRTLVRRR